MLNEGSGTWLEAVVYRDGERHEGVEIVRNALSRTIWQDRTSWWNGRGVMVGQDYGRSLEWRERRVEEVAGWFRGIETGDVVEVWARAGSGNWVCQVNLVEVTVLYAL